MTPSHPPSPRRWYRCTIRRIMIAVPVCAIAIVLVAGIDPFRRDPLQDALAQSVLACSDPTETFPATSLLDWSTKPNATTIPDKPELINGKCVLKIHHATHVISKGGKIEATFGSQVALAEDGRDVSRHWSTMGSGGGSGTCSPSQLATIKAILATLPPSQTDIPPGRTESGMWIGIEPELRTENRAFVIGFWRQGLWVTRTYDDRNKPPAVARLLHDFFPGSGNFFEYGPTN